MLSNNFSCSYGKSWRGDGSFSTTASGRLEKTPSLLACCLVAKRYVWQALLPFKVKIGIVSIPNQYIIWTYFADYCYFVLTYCEKKLEFFKNGKSLKWAKMLFTNYVYNEYERTLLITGIFFSKLFWPIVRKSWNFSKMESPWNELRGCSQTVRLITRRGT